MPKRRAESLKYASVYMPVIEACANLDKFDTNKYLSESDSWHYKGEGSFSTVYAHNSEPIVCKVFSNEDKATLFYLEYCLKHYSNPHCMKVFKLHKGTSRSFAFMEKLQGMYDDETSVTALDTLERVLDETEHFELNRGAWRDRCPLSAQLRTIIEDSYLYVITRGYDMGVDCGLDFHNENVMVRPGTDVPVISDPVAHWYDEESCEYPS